MAHKEPWTVLNTLRIQRGWTYTDLAHESGLSPTHVRDCCSGRRTPSPSTVDALAKALDVDAVDLIPPGQLHRHTDSLLDRLRTIDRLAASIITKLENVEEAHTA